jgi:hypothetical protein
MTRPWLRLGHCDIFAIMLRRMGGGFAVAAANGSKINILNKKLLCSKHY